MVINYISQPATAKILIVDDNPQNLQVLGKILQESNYDVEFAISGEATLEWLKNKKFDMILLDINMPGMNGFEICKIIRNNMDLNEMPIIFLSANTDRETILKGFEYGAQDYVTKPFDNRELMARVKTHLALKASREQLKKLNLVLEEKVNERTIQLSDALGKLEFANISLKGLDKAKADFLKMISHQIRTPLNGLLGPIQLLRENKESRIVKMVEIMDISVKRLEKFAMNALLITEIKTEGENIPKGNFILLELINKCITDESTAENILNKNIKIEIKPFNQNLLVVANPRLMQIVFSNVLDNAIQFSNPSGEIKIEVIEDEKSVVVEISDHGIGFNEKSLETVNKQLLLNDLPINPNLGLGMNLVKLIIDFHKGKVEVLNNQHHGACVRLTLN